jgi:GH15 family glucan-1,4-alpha-glucosidase
MPRDIPIGNGALLVAYDSRGFIRDLFFPAVGMENHAQGHPFRAGLWVDGAFSWFDGEGWERLTDYEDGTLVARISLVNRALAVELTLRDVVDFHENLLVREIAARNLSHVQRDLRVFFHHDFHIYGTDIGDTACYKPEVRGLLHYKGRRYFLINALNEEGAGVSQFATGSKETGRYHGTWADAEDGELSGNPITQGSVDSTCAVHMRVPGGGESKAYYWMAACTGWRGVLRMNDLVTKRSPAYFIKRTADYWRLWLEKEEMEFGDLPAALVRLYKRSLLVLRTNIDDSGAIIAAADSDILHFNKDTYSYTWPRDGAIIAHALALARYPVPSRRFFEFCSRIIGRNGYFLHKYNTDGSLASSWHPWVLGGEPTLPIQEDEAGLVVWAIWEQFQVYRDIEFIKPLYRKLIKSTADFMCGFIDEKTGLPLPSYDLWEERLGIHTFTVCAVVAGLKAAARFTSAFGETGLSSKYSSTAENIQGAMVKHLYDGERGRFLRSVYINARGLLKKDLVLDSSLCGLFTLGVFPATDEKVASTMDALRKTLWCKTERGGMARYENDAYQTALKPTRDIPGNPWVICTLWHARYLVERASTEGELHKALPVLDLVARSALPSGVLAEQLHPVTGEPLSISPLTWSHGEFVITVQGYLRKMREIKTCPVCAQPVPHGHKG